MPTTRKPYKGPAMEGVIARWYARITARDRGYHALAAEIAARLPPGARVLEVAPGPGYLAVELARRGLRVTAVDISRSFVRIASDNARAAGVTIDACHGNASQLPCADGSFDFVVCRAAFKNFSDPLGALDEVYRVLAPGGRASIIDLRREASRDDIRAEVDAMELGWLNTLWTRATFRWFLLKNAYAQDALEELVQRSRFGRGDVRRDGIGFDLRLEKPLTAAPDAHVIAGA
jgi:ubiquinone/menaquinone biosynthesis C-methylase UbiE